MILQVKHFLPVESSIIHGVIVALGQNVQQSVLIELRCHDSVHDWNVLAFDLIYNDISVLDWSVFCQEENVTSLHGWLHRAG